MTTTTAATSAARVRTAIASIITAAITSPLQQQLHGHSEQERRMRLRVQDVFKNQYKR